MYESYATKGALALKETDPTATARPEEHNWAAACATSVVDQFKTNPIGTGGTALLALLALRFKTPILEEMAASIAGVGKTAAKSGSGVPLIRASRGIAGETPAVAETTAAEGSTFVSPWARAAVKDAGALAEQPATAASSMFARVMPKEVSADMTVIPTFTTEISKSGVRSLSEGAKIVPRFSTEGSLFHNMKDSTVRILESGSTVGVGTGFFVDAKGFIATAEHVVSGIKGPIQVELAGGKVVPARLVAREKDADWALLKVDALAGPVRPFEFASARELKPNVPTFLIGNPDGVATKAMTRGLFDGLHKYTPDGHHLYVKHTADSFYGMSGAPITLPNWKVIGIHGLSRGNSSFAEGIHIRHLRRPLDTLRSRDVKGIDWETEVNLTTNARNMPKITSTGRLASPENAAL